MVPYNIYHLHKTANFPQIIALNLSNDQLLLNNGTFWRPTVASVSAPTDILKKLPTPDAEEWISYLRENEEKEEAKIR